MGNRPKRNLVWINKESDKFLGYEIKDAIQIDAGDTILEVYKRDPIAGWGLQEGAIAAAITVYIFGPYLRAIMSEAGKDHYNAVKHSLSEIFSKRPEDQDAESEPEINFEILIGKNIYITVRVPAGLERPGNYIDKMLNFFSEIDRDQDSFMENLPKELMADREEVWWENTIYCHYDIASEKWEISDHRKNK